MTDKTLGIIYAIKKSESPYDGVKQFMEKYTGHYNYTRREIYEIVEQTFCECLDDLDHPSLAIKMYFNTRGYPQFLSQFDAMVITLQMLQVKRWNTKTNSFHYVNGFRPLEEFGYD